MITTAHARQVGGNLTTESTERNKKNIFFLGCPLWLN